MQFRLMSLNIFHGQWIERAVDYIKQENIDICLLQEVTNGEVGDTGKFKSNNYSRLVESTGMRGVYAGIWDFVNQDKVFNLGLAVLSRFPIINSTNYFYYDQLRNLKIEEFDGDKIFPGNVLSSVIEIEKKKVNILTTHFIWSLYPEETGKQKKAADALIKYLEKLDSFILGGDFNLTDKSESYQKLTQACVDDRPKALENTLNSRLHRIPGIRLPVDFVFHKGEGLKVLNSRVPDVDISDHLPVIVDYELNS
jgi:endonuclease/exonuclease/phosphatase family metal-dependent hydrolase